MTDHLALGRAGEKIAQNYLKKQNYLILETNWRFRKAEIDIICSKNNILIFVEVKTRSRNIYGKPEEFVKIKKERMLFDAANVYMEKMNHIWEIRFDIISIILNNDKLLSLDHFEDAFFPGIE